MTDKEYNEMRISEMSRELRKLFKLEMIFNKQRQKTSSLILDLSRNNVISEEVKKALLDVVG